VDVARDPRQRELRRRHAGEVDREAASRLVDGDRQRHPDEASRPTGQALARHRNVRVRDGAGGRARDRHGRERDAGHDGRDRRSSHGRPPLALLGGARWICLRRTKLRLRTNCASPITNAVVRSGLPLSRAARSRSLPTSRKRYDPSFFERRTSETTPPPSVDFPTNRFPRDVICRSRSKTTIVPPPGVASCNATPPAGSAATGASPKVPAILNDPGPRGFDFRTRPKLTLALVMSIVPARTTRARVPSTVDVVSEFSNATRSFSCRGVSTSVFPCRPCVWSWTFRPAPRRVQTSSVDSQGRMTSSNVGALPSWRYGAVFQRSTSTGVT